MVDFICVQILVTDVSIILINLKKNFGSMLGVYILFVIKVKQAFYYKLNGVFVIWCFEYENKL